jgi:hypothetical protein
MIAVSFWKPDITANMHQFRKWAHSNALTLTFLSAMFIITWIVIVVANYAT